MAKYNSTQYLQDVVQQEIKRLFTSDEDTKIKVQKLNDLQTLLNLAREPQKYLAFYRLWKMATTAGSLMYDGEKLVKRFTLQKRRKRDAS